MAAGHVRISLTVGRGIVEIAPAVDHLLRRAAADAELQPPAGDQIRRAGVFHHVQRVFITHVDHASADLDALGFGADGGQQRERRSQLARKVVYAKIGAVRPQIFGGDRQIDGLQQRIRCGTVPDWRKATSGRTRENQSFSSGIILKGKIIGLQ